ncbi:hypothetical protein J7E97_16040 [Streptomyces sp. ISL-66]|uniref:hypothetical protein n=1 Tax=Streptomyces sp. ISL-66 TaxID=2819186 RepID=UPI001BE6AFA7|nr:hypothetical protein [Streptomyces sp. ISL-66]MBT2469345.1 hypothetical protein [Streptomyces sp. ISL-66]
MKPTAPLGRLIRQWRGHVVEVSPKGLAIDGRTVDSTALTERDAVRPTDDVRTHPSLQFLDSGSLVYRGHVQAEVHPGDEVTVHGPNGPVWPPERGQGEHARGPSPPQPDDDFDIDIAL